jgi:hypothetical protein
MNFGKALEKIARGFGLVDVWETVPPRAAYTHYTSHGAACRDRIHVISNLSDQKVGVETVFAAFTERLAVCVRIELEVPLLQRGQGLWEMKAKLLEDTTISRRGQRGD